MINYHSLFFSLGAVLAGWIYWRLSRPLAGWREDLPIWDVFWIFLGGLLGARLLWAFTSPPQFWWQYFTFWEVGLVSFGGIISGTVVAWWRLRFRPRPDEWALALLPGVLIGWAVGRVGNFLIRDAYGVAWPDAPSWLYGRVPIQLLEALLCLLLAGVVYHQRLRWQRSKWSLIMLAGVIYFAGRLLIDQWRDLPTAMVGINSSQAVAGLLLLCATLGLWLTKKQP